MTGSYYGARCRGQAYPPPASHERDDSNEESCEGGKHVPGTGGWRDKAKACAGVAIMMAGLVVVIRHAWP